MDAASETDAADSARAVEQGPFGVHLFARGFCITRRHPPLLPAHFEVATVDEYHVARDTRTRFAVARQPPELGGSFVCLLGYVLNPEVGTSDGQAIAAQLLDALGRSEEELFEVLDDLCGRFVVFYAASGTATVLADATSTRSIFYNRSGELVVASHYELARRIGGTGPSIHYSQHRTVLGLNRTAGYPGITTPDQNIAILPANTLLRLASRTTRRFYPRTSLPTLTVDDAADALALHFRRQLQVLARDHRVFASLTGGLDSRTTLAAARPWKNEFVLFSYHSLPAHAIDVRLAQDICQRLGIAHKLIDVVSRKSGDANEFSALARLNSYHTHLPKVGREYLSDIPMGSIHLRSNLYEIARAFWRKKGPRNSPIEPLDMAICYFPTVTAENVDVIDAFREFIDLADYRGDLCGFDPYDLFYWEHRMSVWHSQVLLEADPAFDTYLLFNCRRCIELGLSVPLQDRIAGSVFTTLITRQWPELDAWPINPKKYPVP